MLDLFQFSGDYWDMWIWAIWKNDILNFYRDSFQLNQLSHNLLHSKMDHEKELQNLKEQTESRVELGKYVQLQMELLDQQKQLNDMQNSIEFKDCENNKELQGEV